MFFAYQVIVLDTFTLEEHSEPDGINVAFRVRQEEVLVVEAELPVFGDFVVGVVVVYAFVDWRWFSRWLRCPDGASKNL